MTQADVAVELQYFLWMVAIVFVAATILGLSMSSARKSVPALVLATAFTAVGMLSMIRPTDPVDGQTGMNIPVMWIPFFAVSWLGLVIGAKLASKKAAGR